MTFRSVVALFVTISLLTVACKSSKSSSDSVILTKNHWVLVEVQGKPTIHAGTNKEASLRFSAEGNKVTGSTGCNRMFGTYELPGGDKIRFSGIGSTRMACPDMSTENAFMKALEKTNAYDIAGKELMLKSDQAIVARLRAEPSQ